MNLYGRVTQKNTSEVDNAGKMITRLLFYPAK